MPPLLRLDLRLLGRFAVGIDGDPEGAIRLSSRKSRALLAYLAMQPTLSETRERLADLLWGNSNDKQARQSLRQCLASLRKEIEPAGADLLLIDQETVALAAGRVAVDARDFLRLAESTAAADLEQAADLYAGAFLDKLDLDVEPFSDWVRSEQARLASLAAQVFESCATSADAAGRGAPAIKAAERLVALDPLNEAAQGLLLRLLARYRGRDAALAHADAVEALLRRELGVDPELETRALIAEIRTASGARSVTAGPPISPARASSAPATSMPATEPDLPASGTGGAQRVTRVTPTVVLAVLAGALVVGAGLFAFVPHHQPAPAATKVAAESATPRNQAEQSWVSPILPGVTADQKWVGAQGMYAVLVLPFTSDSPDRAAERMLADRLGDDLTSDLSRVPAIRVISRQTARLYRGRPVDVAAVGAELGVRYVVEGHVRLDESRATIDVALTDTASRLHVWSERFTRDAVSSSELHDEITRGLARQLQISVIGTEDQRRLPSRDASEASIRDLLAKGWGAVVRMSAADRTGGAESYFEEVLKRDPDNVSGMTGLAASYVQAATMYLLADPQPRLERAEVLLRRAISLNPHTTLAYFYLGMLEKNRGRPHAALAAFTKVLELNPSYAPAYAQVGHVLSRIGKLNEAIEQVRYAIRLSPKDHALGIWALFGGQIELERGHDDLAIEWLSRAAELTPRSPFAHASLAALYALRSDHASMTKHVDEARKLAPWLTLEKMKERVIGLSDQGGEPRRLLEGLRLAFAERS
jgi:DNA-binding SARP family transcriptional activator/TolB-like protein/Tfp pilus assembly protein PilF